VKKPPLTEEDEAVLAKMLANREKRRQLEAERGLRPPLPPGGTFEKKWQEPFLAGAFPEEPRPPSPKFTFSAADASARGLPPIAATVDALASALVPVAPICKEALFSLAGPAIALHAVLGRPDEALDQTLRRCVIVDDVARADTIRGAVAGVATDLTCFTWLRGEAPRAACVASIDVGGAPIVVVLECGAGLMAKPTCSQVLATGMLGEVAGALRLGLVGA
jgi:hypothetical protein